MTHLTATLDELPKFSYNESEISNKLYGELNQAIKDGKINQAEYDSFVKGKTASNGAGGGANVVERPAQIQREGGSVKPAEQSGNVKIPQTDEAGFLLEKKTAQEAEKIKVGQASSENRIPDGKDQAGKLTESQPEKNIQSQTPQSEKKVYSLKKQYTETEKKSIMKKAVSSTGDNSSIVKRVTNSINKVMTDMTEYFQNEHERVRQLVERKDVKISDESDPYLKMTLYPGRVAEKITKTKDEIKKIVKEMEKEKVTRKEISDYLVARHAPERNAAIGEKAAGISTSDAKIKNVYYFELRNH